MFPLKPINWGIDPTDVGDPEAALGTDGTTVTDSALSVLGAIGANSANNAFASNLVAANADGSVMERLEFLQSYVPALAERCVEKSDGAVLNAAGVGDPIFVVSGGPVKAKIFGLVTTVIGGAANMSLQIATVAPAATVTLSAAPVAIDNDAVGTFYRNVGATSVFTPSTALGLVLSDPVTVEETDLILSPGTVAALASAPQTGNIKWYMVYKPLSPASVVTAAA
jgi:hypothetical protein